MPTPVKRIFFPIILIITLSAYAQPQSSLLWEISGNGLEKPSYLFGTIHILPKKEYFFTNVMKEKFNDCEVLTMEIDISEMNLMDKIDLAKQMMLKNGQTLQGLMGDSAYHSFRTYLADSLGIKEKKIDNQYNRFKPFFVNSLLMKDYLGKVTFYEQELLKNSKKKDMATLGLETAEYQLSLIDNIPVEEQIDYFLDVKSMHLYDSLLTIYKSQDLDELYDFSMDMDEISPDDTFLNDFIITRNNDWIPKIEEIIGKQPAFIAVGALHLPGEKGVIELLRQKGYTVKPVK